MGSEDSPKTWDDAFWYDGESQELEELEDDDDDDPDEVLDALGRLELALFQSQKCVERMKQLLEELT